MVAIRRPDISTPHGSSRRRVVIFVFGLRDMAIQFRLLGMGSIRIRLCHKTIGAILLIQSAWQVGWAAVPQLSVTQKSRKTQVVAQRQIGGMAGPGFSLLNIHRSKSANGKVERLVFSIGDRNGKPLIGVPGYFNAQNQKNRIVLDFAQMPVSRLDEKAIHQALKQSDHVKSVKMIRDPTDQTLTLILDLKGPVKMKALQVKGQKQTARVILDIIKR